MGNFMCRVEPSSDWTILNYLNEDCWRVLLKYVPVRDVIRSERTSRQWQTQVLLYLQGFRINVVDENDRPKKSHLNACTLKLPGDAYESFAMWTSKLGTTIVAAYCNSLETLKIIHDNCPNLESLMIIDIQNCGSGKVPYNLNKDFKHLQDLYIYSCDVSDQDVNRFIADKAIEELEVRFCNVLGDFLNTINLSNLKSLAFEQLDRFEPDHLNSALGLLSELKKLVIAYMPLEEAEGIKYVLEKTEKLEHLELYDRTCSYSEHCEALSRLVHLKYLRTSFLVYETELDAILQGCKELRTLELIDCLISYKEHFPSIIIIIKVVPGWRCAEACCHYGGARLRSLTLLELFCYDDDLVAIIGGCVELTTLVVGGATTAGGDYLSPALPARAAAARRAARAGRPRGPRLLLDLSGTTLTEPEELKKRFGNYEPMQTDFEDLVIDLNAKDI